MMPIPQRFGHSGTSGTSGNFYGIVNGQQRKGDYYDDNVSASLRPGKLSSAIPMKQKEKVHEFGNSVNMGFLPSTGYGKEKDVVREIPSEANIPIVPIPIRSNETEQEPQIQTDYQPVFIFDDFD